MWLCMGKRVNDKELPRRTWLISLGYLLAVEKDITPIQNSIPYQVGSGYSKLLQENRGDACHLFEPWELEWQGKSVWWPTKKHPIWNWIDSSMLSDQEENNE